jgi:hypothetical protein
MCNTLIKHRSFKEGLGLIDYCYSTPGSTLLISGAAGVGKTTLINEGIKQLEKTETSQKILFIKLYPPLNVRDFLEKLLKNIGDTNYDKGYLNDKRKRVISLIKDTGIKLMVIDNFQDILISSYLSKEIIGILTEILDSTGVSLVTVAVLEKYTHSKSLEGLFQRELFMEEMPYWTIEEKKSFKSILKDIEQQLGFEKPSDLIDFSNEIYDVTNGNIGKLMTLITGADYLSKKFNEPNISLKYLFLSSDGMHGIPKENAFYHILRAEQQDAN